MAAIPEGLTFEEAAPSSEGSHYARSSIRSAPNDYKQHLLANCTAFCASLLPEAPASSPEDSGHCLFADDHSSHTG